METIIFFFVVLVIVGAANLSRRSRGGNHSAPTGMFGRDLEGSARAELTRYGVTTTSIWSQAASSRYHEGVVHFSGVDKGGVEVAGTVEFSGGIPRVNFDSSTAGVRAARAQGRLVDAESADPAALDPEQQIRQEVARRLDAMQSERAAFLANDTDGDGLVDADEWAAARARIEAEVRAELGSAPPVEPPAADEVPVSPPRNDHW